MYVKPLGGRDGFNPRNAKYELRITVESQHAENRSRRSTTNCQALGFVEARLDPFHRREDWLVRLEVHPGLDR
jgi:hypothetical protein